jgi:hypothetical protein
MPSTSWRIACNAPRSRQPRTNEFNPARLCNAAVLNPLRFLPTPGVAVKELMGIKRDTGRIEAQDHE